MRRQRRRQLIILAIVVLVGLAGLAWYWWKPVTTVSSVVLRASTPTYTKNPTSGLYDSGWVNGQVPGVVTFFLVNDTTGPNGVQYHITVHWTPPPDTTGIGGYQVVWQWGSLTHLGPWAGYLSSEDLNSLVPASVTSYTLTARPGLYSLCSACTLTNDDSCIQFYIVSCASATDTSTCGSVPIVRDMLPHAMACYNPSTIYGYNGCCGCFGNNYCIQH